MNLSSLGDDFLDSSFEGEAEVEKIPLVLLEEGAPDPRFLRLSYSGNLLQHSCPRKFQLKCLGAERIEHESSNTTFAYGHVVGEGIQNLLLKMDWNQVLIKVFLGWHADLFAENEKQKKSLFSAIYCLMQFRSLMNGGFLDEYEVAMFNGVPAAELSFRIHFPFTTFRGHVDLVLRHKITGELLVLELKTSSANYVQGSAYKNSSQAIGYSVILDRIEPDATSYGVLYLVYLTKLARFETFEFPKTYHQRALWIRDRIVDEAEVVRLIKEEGNYGIWPMQGESCNSFGRECEYMDICHLSTEHQVSPLNERHLIDLNRDTGEEQKYQFEIQLSELLEGIEMKRGEETHWEVAPPSMANMPKAFQDLNHHSLSSSSHSTSSAYSNFPGLDAL